MQDLGAEGGYSQANGINHDDMVVGIDSTNAFLWTPNAGRLDLNGMVKLPSTRIVLREATAINRWGQITANAWNDTAWLLTPIMKVAIDSSPNPSVHGQEVTFTATVTSIAGPPPDGEQVVFQSGTRVLGTGSLIGGVATASTASLGAGKHAVRAIYSGDTIYDAHKSAEFVQVVVR
jgi:uncharacterized membrane protein